MAEDLQFSVRSLIFKVKTPSMLIRIRGSLLIGCRWRKAFCSIDNPCLMSGRRYFDFKIRKSNTAQVVRPLAHRSSCIELASIGQERGKRPLDRAQFRGSAIRAGGHPRRCLFLLDTASDGVSHAAMQGKPDCFAIMSS